MALDEVPANEFFECERGFEINYRLCGVGVDDGAGDGFGYGIHAYGGVFGIIIGYGEAYAVDGDGVSLVEFWGDCRRVYGEFCHCFGLLNSFNSTRCFDNSREHGCIVMILYCFCKDFVLFCLERVHLGLLA